MKEIELINLLDLETEELDLVDAAIVELEEDCLFTILPVSSKTDMILSRHPEVEVLKRGTNWQVANIDLTIVNELENANQMPFFCYGETINNFR